MRVVSILETVRLKVRSLNRLSSYRIGKGKYNISLKVILEYLTTIRYDATQYGYNKYQWCEIGILCVPEWADNGLFIHSLWCFGMDNAAVC